MALIKELEKEINKIKERNEKVEADKAHCLSKCGLTAKNN